MTVEGWEWDAGGFLASPETRGLLLMMSRDPDATRTFLATTPAGQVSRPVCKIPTSATSERAVDHEARLLVALRRMQLGPVAETIPRYVSTGVVEGRQVLVSTSLPGAPMSVDYHRWRHTSRPAPVARDLEVALGWLAAFQESTVDGVRPLTWSAEVSAALSTRWEGDRALPLAAAHLAAAHAELGAQLSPVTAVHGDFWYGNVLVAEDRVTGVVDWEEGQLTGWPLRDVGRFLVSYSLYLDRHTSPGRSVAGHGGLRRVGFAPGIAYALTGRGWYPRLVRSTLAGALQRLGLPAHLWYAVALTAVGEVAATANHADFARGHLELLASLPRRPHVRRG